jgi:hypothetical protein
MGTQVAVKLLPVPECRRAAAARALLAQCLDEMRLGVAVGERVGDFSSPSAPGSPAYSPSPCPAGCSSPRRPPPPERCCCSVSGS